MKEEEKITSDYYEKYVGCYAKRFYSHFKKENIYKIKEFKIKNYFAYFVIKQDGNILELDIEDFVIITNEQPTI